MGFLDEIKAKGPKIDLPNVSLPIDLGAVALEKINGLLDEYKKAVTVLETYGFKIGTFKFAAIPPQVDTSITVAVALLQQDALKKVIEQHPDQPMLGTMLNAVIQAKGLYDRIGLTCGSAVLQVRLAIPPSVSVEFH